MADCERLEMKGKMRQFPSLIINALYSNKDIFLRELISNASHALDKIHKKNSDAGFIRLVLCKAEKTLSISDNGIGMTKADLINNLVECGTKVEEALQAGVEVNMIGQLGVGFYSAYMVADKVVLTTKHDGHDQYIWESQAGASFTLARDPDGQQLLMGTKITLFLKDDQLEYLEEARIKDLVRKHSQYITHPIYLLMTGDDDDQPEKKQHVKDVHDDKINNTSHVWQRINIWLPKPREEECASFCSHHLLLPAGLQLQAEIEKISVGTMREILGNHIPDHLAISILLKLPLKSLKRFGSVQQSWPLLFENPHFIEIFRNNFISNYHSHSNNTSPLLFLVLPPILLSFNVYQFNVSLFLLSGESFQNRVELDWPYHAFQKDSHSFIVLGSTSVNGILCLYKPRVDTVVFWNPATKEFKVIPPSPTEIIPPNANVETLILFQGFGYDCVRDDYKVIRHVCFFPRDDDEPCDLNFYMDLWEIYSLRSNSWRKLDVDLPMCCDDLNRFYLDGMCHWLGDSNTDNETYLVSFDLSNEVYFETPMPLDIPLDMHDSFDIHLVIRHLLLLNASISLISNYADTTTFYISILAELGVKESWIKLFVVGPVSNIRFPIGSGKMNTVFFGRKDGGIIWFDLSTNTIEELRDGNTSWWCQILTYKESLLPIGG